MMILLSPWSTCQVHPESSAKKYIRISAPKKTNFHFLFLPLCITKKRKFVTKWVPWEELMHIALGFNNFQRRSAIVWAWVLTKGQGVVIFCRSHDSWSLLEPRKRPDLLQGGGLTCSDGKSSGSAIRFLPPRRYIPASVPISIRGRGSCCSPRHHCHCTVGVLKSFSFYAGNPDTLNFTIMSLFSAAIGGKLSFAVLPFMLKTNL